MKKIVVIVLFVIIGLVFGYLVFGRIAGEYVDLNLIFAQTDSGLESFGRNIAGLTKMKQNILLSGGAGAILGFIISLIRKK
jgi:hypothetical protein